MEGLARYDEFVCEARVRFRGKDLALDRIVSRIDLEGMLPPRGLTGPFDYPRVVKASERRKRFVDMLASEFAHALTEALYSDKVWER